jgi:hypothetical protein
MHPNSVSPFLPILALSLCLTYMVSCNSSDDNQYSGTDYSEPVGSQDWLTGDLMQKLETITDHLRGFDMAMVETGYRHVELYWAGQDENWGYAQYQIEKLQLAIERGLERRPARAASAQEYLELALPSMKEAVEERDPNLFNERFETFTQSCNACHHAEQVPHFNVQIPENRITGIKMP